MPADGMRAAAENGDFGTSRWQPEGKATSLLQYQEGGNAPFNLTSAWAERR